MPFSIFDMSNSGRIRGAKHCEANSSRWPMFTFRANQRKRQATTEAGKQHQMRVIGIDPGLRTLGWGVIEMQGSRLTHVENGLCTSSARDDLGARLLSLHDQLTAIIDRLGPAAAAVEQTFVNRDGKGTLKLGQARGIAMLVPARAGITVGEYAPNAVKKAIVGVGHAEKHQIEHMIGIHFPGVRVAGPDAADALAIAVTHAHHLQSSSRLSQAIARAS